MAVGRSTSDPEELDLYEGLRRGSGRAFRRLLELHSAPMLRVASWYLPDRADAERLVRRTWMTALDGLNMFTWHCTFRAWLFGILVAGGRAQTVTPLAMPRAAPDPPPVRPAPGTLDWSSLPWSPQWSKASWQVLEAGLDALPLPQREVLLLRDVEGWPPREVCDVLALTEHEEHRALHAGRTELVERLRRHLGASACGECEQPSQRLTEYLEGAAGTGVEAHIDRCPACRCRLERVRGLAEILRLLVPGDKPAPPDPDLLAAFRRWRVARGLRPWHRLPLGSGRA